MNSERDSILARVRQALAPLPRRVPLPEWDHENVRPKTDPAPGDLWPRFCERLRAVNGTPLTAAELPALLEAGGWRRGYCDPALWPRLQAVFPAGFTVETDYERARVDDYDFGLTAATGAIAETGTLILSDRDTPRRLAALAPWVHVAALRRDQIHADIPTALARLPDDPNIVWVTGPSKTADIEGILIEGVHGPGVQVALLLD